MDNHFAFLFIILILNLILEIYFRINIKSLLNIFSKIDINKEVKYTYEVMLET